MKTRTKTQRAFASILLLALIGSGCWWWKHDRVFSLLSSTDRIEVFRIDGHNYAPQGHIQKNSIIATSRIAKPKDVKALSQLLLRYMKNPSWRLDASACDPQPGIAFRFWQGKEHLDVEVCFQCNVMTIYHKKGGNRDFSFARPLLVKLAKQAFPNDKTVKDLAERADYDPYPEDASD